MAQVFSLSEIRNFMLNNGGKVTNHALVKYFKKFLTNPDTQGEARKNFKTYVNILATSKTEGNEKYLLLRKRYYNECPSEDNFSVSSAPMSPNSESENTSFRTISESDGNSFRSPPPYRPPPEVSPQSVLFPSKRNDPPSAVQYKDCINEFQFAVNSLANTEMRKNSVDSIDSEDPPIVPPRKRNSVEKSMPREQSIETPDIDLAKNAFEIPSQEEEIFDSDNKISVKEAMMKFNRIASIEEQKVPSPVGKKKPEKGHDDKENISSENLINHPKAKEWIVSAARANYQDLAKLSSEYPDLVKLGDPNTGYTALHWAAKHGNEDIVKLIAGTHQANVNARTNGGYTPLHISMQFEKDNIFELLCNVYKANRDLLDWSGKKPLDYRKQKTSVSASTYSKIKARKKHSEKDLGFLRIGSLNVRVKKTTEAIFSNFLGTTNRVPLNSRTSAPPNSNHFEKIHKNWGSADNIPQENSMIMPPPNGPIKKRKSKRAGDYGMSINNIHSQSVPSTPNQIRASHSISEHPCITNDSDSDSAYGFESHESHIKRNSIGKNEGQRPTYI